MQGHPPLSLPSIRESTWAEVLLEVCPRLCLPSSALVASSRLPWLASSPPPSRGEGGLDVRLAHIGCRLVELPVLAEDFAQFLIHDFRDNGESLVVAPGGGFYEDPEHGKKFTLWETIANYAWHCQHHLAHNHDHPK